MTAHWHEHNPWAEKAVYVALEDLAACVHPASIMTAERMLAHWSQAGDQLDAYILPSLGPLGHSAGVRYGAEPSEYLSPYCDQERLSALLETVRLG